MANEDGNTGVAMPARRQIAVMLSSGTSIPRMLESLRPLIERDEGVELSAVFVEELELEIAARLPFVRELCRLTSEVREFRAGEARRDLSRSIREARVHFESAAARARAVHTFRTVRGTMHSALREIATSADVTFFEPFRVAARTRLYGQEAGPALRGPVAVFVAGAKSAGPVTRAGFELARRRFEDLIVLHTPEVGEISVIEAALETVVPPGRLRIEALPDTSIHSLALVTQRLGAVCLVMGSADIQAEDETLGALSAELPCPLLWVRRWP